MFPKDIVFKEIFRPKSDSLKLVSAHIGKSDSEIVAMANENQLALWQAITARSEGQGKRTLAKIFYYHTQADGPLMRHFHNRSNVIHLIRRNLFDVYVSETIAHQTGKWQSWVGEDTVRQPEPFRIERSDFDKFFEKRTEEIRFARAYFGGDSNYHEVFYEDIAGDPNHCANAIARIYGIDPAPSITINRRKQKTEANEALITNYSEVKDLDICLDWGTA